MYNSPPPPAITFTTRENLKIIQIWQLFFHEIRSSTEYAKIIQWIVNIPYRYNYHFVFVFFASRFLLYFEVPVFILYFPQIASHPQYNPVLQKILQTGLIRVYWFMSNYNNYWNFLQFIYQHLEDFYQKNILLRYFWQMPYRSKRKSVRYDDYTPTK